MTQRLLRYGGMLLVGALLLCGTFLINDRVVGSAGFPTSSRHRPGSTAGPSQSAVSRPGRNPSGRNVERNPTQSGGSHTPFLGDAVDSGVSVSRTVSRRASGGLLKHPSTAGSIDPSGHRATVSQRSTSSHPRSSLRRHPTKSSADSWIGQSVSQTSRAAPEVRQNPVTENVGTVDKVTAGTPQTSRSPRKGKGKPAPDKGKTAAPKAGGTQHSDLLRFNKTNLRIGELHGLGSYIAQRSRPVSARLLNLASQTGVRWLREEFTADKLHGSPAGVYDWAPYDKVVTQERGVGFHILGLLDYNNTWSGQGHAYMPHSNMRQIVSDFAMYAYAVARHYRNQITDWQVWNEPDLAKFWRPYPNARDYATLLNAAYAAIKRANPQATVVLGGPSGADPNAINFIDQVVKAGGKFDITSIQPYNGAPNGALLQEVKTLREFGRPIWFTEIGWSGEDWCERSCGTETSQADKLARIYLIAAIAGVQRVFWYDLRDDGSAPWLEDHFGLLQRNLSIKPAFTAYRLSAYLLDGAHLIGIAKLSNSVLALKFKNHGQQFFVIWNDALTSWTSKVNLNLGPSTSRRLAWKHPW